MLSSVIFENSTFFFFIIFPTSENAFCESLWDTITRSQKCLMKDFQGSYIPGFLIFQENFRWLSTNPRPRYVHRWLKLRTFKRLQVKLFEIYLWRRIPICWISARQLSAASSLFQAATAGCGSSPLNGENSSFDILPFHTDHTSPNVSHF